MRCLESVLKGLLGALKCVLNALQYRIRFSKLVNKTLLKSVCNGFRKWIHLSADEEKRKQKLRLIRTLCSEDPDEAALLSSARSRVGGALVAYAKGNPTVKTVKPYGLKAGRSTREFLKLPDTTLALTFAAMYQVLRTEESQFDKWINTPRENITQPWQRGTIKRYVQLQQVFAKNRAYVFKAYENAGGEYMGEDEPEVEKNDTTPKTSPIQFEEDFE